MLALVTPVLTGSNSTSSPLVAILCRLTSLLLQHLAVAAVTRPSKHQRTAGHGSQRHRSHLGMKLFLTPVEAFIHPAVEAFPRTG